MSNNVFKYSFLDIFSHNYCKQYKSSLVKGVMTSRPIILDTNFLLVPFQFKINIMREIEYLLEISHFFVISSQTIVELRNIGKGKGKDGGAARLAIKMIENNDIKIIENSEHVDNWIIDYAKENNAIVCTNDAPLRRKLKRLGIKMITMKSKSSLGFI